MIIAGIVSVVADFATGSARKLSQTIVHIILAPLPVEPLQTLSPSQSGDHLVIGKKRGLRSRWSCFLQWSLSFVLALSGCATKKLPDHPLQPVSYSPYSQVKDGLAIAIQPLTNSQESEKYFGVDLLAAGILAIFVTAENRDSPSSFLVSKEQFSLRTGQTEASSSPRRAQLSSEVPGEVVATAGALLISFPILFVGTKLISDANVVKHNFAVKELQAKTISSGEEAHGFVYFQLPQGYAGSSQWTLHVEVQDLRMKEMKSFDFTFTGTKG